MVPHQEVTGLHLPQNLRVAIVAVRQLVVVAVVAVAVTVVVEVQVAAAAVLAVDLQVVPEVQDLQVVAPETAEVVAGN